MTAVSVFDWHRIALTVGIMPRSSPVACGVGDLRVRVEPRVCVLGRGKLSVSLRNSPAPGRPIYGHHCPSVTVLVAEVHEKSSPVVLDAQPVGGVVLLGEDARLLFLGIGQERGPTRAWRPPSRGEGGRVGVSE